VNGNEEEKGVEEQNAGRKGEKKMEEERPMPKVPLWMPPRLHNKSKSVLQMTSDGRNHMGMCTRRQLKHDFLANVPNQE